MAPRPHHLQVAAVASGAGSSGSRLIVINAHTGALEQSLTAEGEAAQLLHLPQPLHDGSADQHAFVLVPPAGTGAAAKVLPDTAEARAAFQAARPGLGFWRIDEEAGSIQGLGFSGEAWLGRCGSGDCSFSWDLVLAQQKGACLFNQGAAFQPPYLATTDFEFAAPFHLPKCRVWAGGGALVGGAGARRQRPAHPGSRGPHPGRGGGEPGSRAGRRQPQVQVRIWGEQLRGWLVVLFLHRAGIKPAPLPPRLKHAALMQ